MTLFEVIKSGRVILLDGAMGTQLDKRGLMGSGRNNLDAPEAVCQVHKEYIDCGSDAVITNTLTMNRVYIDTHNVEVDVKEVNTAGAKIARQAAGDKGKFVLGDMSSTGQMLEPYGDYSEEQFYDNYCEQARFLFEAGADGFILETFFDLREALCALKACKDISSSMPVLVSIAFATAKNGGRTMMGNTAADIANELTQGGADAIGANCGDLDPFQMAEVVSLLKGATDLPLLAQPNAGKPKLVDGKTVFDMGPAEFALGVIKCIEAGARLVGGCCGTSPEHIKDVAEMLEKEA